MQTCKCFGFGKCMKAIIEAHVVKSFMVHTMLLPKDLKVAQLEEPSNLIQHDNHSHQGTPSLRARRGRILMHSQSSVVLNLSQ